MRDELLRSDDDVFADEAVAFDSDGGRRLWSLLLLLTAAADLLTLCGLLTWFFVEFFAVWAPDSFGGGGGRRLWSLLLLLDEFEVFPAKFGLDWMFGCCLLLLEGGVGSCLPIFPVCPPGDLSDDVFYRVQWGLRWMGA